MTWWHLKCHDGTSNDRDRAMVLGALFCIHVVLDQQFQFLGRGEANIVVCVWNVPQGVHAKIISMGKMDRGLMTESFLKGQTGRLIYLELSGLAADMGAEDAQLGTGSESDWKIGWGADLGLMIIGWSNLDLPDYDDRQQCWSPQP